ncbi:hypothetical protein LCGC14_2421200, partial [marine sediment metagenome]
MVGDYKQRCRELAEKADIYWSHPAQSEIGDFDAFVWYDRNRNQITLK